MAKEQKVDPTYEQVWILFTAYGKGSEQARMDVYTIQLRRFVPIDVLRDAVDTILQKQKFLPSLAEIYDVCNDVKERKERLALYRQFESEGW